MHHLYMTNGTINPKLLRKKIIIYGCGNDGKKLFSQLKDLGVNIAYFCDSNDKLQGKKLYGVEILSREQLKNYQDYNLALAFHQYPQVLDKLPEKMEQNIFADYPYKHKGGRKCIICGQNDCTYDKAHFAPFLTERMFEGEEKETKLIHCLNCGLYYSDYRPTDQETGRLYDCYRDDRYVQQRKKYEPEYLNEEFSEENYCQERKESVIRFVGPYIDLKEIKTILDYGGDKGQYIPDEFSYSDKYVYDISGNQTVQGVTLLKNLDTAQRIKWDFILCMHLLEHLSEPLAAIENLVGLLDRNSYLYIELPMQDYMHQYSNVEINEHINFFRETTMNKIAEMFHLKILDIRTDDVGLIRVLYQKAKERVQK